MADYNKLKVTELKDELKARGIPITGLKLKQNFIDKLVEADTLGQTNTSGAVIVSPCAAEHTEEAPEQDSATEVQNIQPKDEEAPHGHATSTQTVTEDIAADNGDKAVFPASKSSEMDVDPDEVQVRPERSIDFVPGGIAEEPVEEGGTVLTAADEEIACVTTERVREPEPSVAAVDGSGIQSAPLETLETPQPSLLPAPSSNTSTSPVPLKEMIEDSKKRKRRSVTPVPSGADVAQKKARASDGSPRITKSVNAITEDGGDVAPGVIDESVSKETKSDPSALEQMQGVTNAAETTDEGNGLWKREQLEFVGATSARPSGDDVVQGPTSLSPPKPERSPEKQSGLAGPGTSLFAALKRRDSDHPQDLPARSLLPPRQDSEEKTVAPALHPATSSLYIRNFKRPLHLPTLRAHLAKIARGTVPPSDSDEDSIVAFFLDSIRTHALVSFRSISAASRVRSALHDTRYPDEKTRDPLWIDFIPDDKVQSWIDVESKSMGHGGAQRWEVVYDKAPGGIEAALQEAGTSAGSQRPNTLSHRQASVSGMQRRLSMSDVQRPLQVEGVHPDRLPLVPQEQTNASNTPREDLAAISRQERSGTGFRALDELFSFTTAKPKLYYKPVSQRVVDRRTGMVKALRVGHEDMGKSGDEDMKRYSFETYRGEEEWVDKGPEFGFGRRGVERMRGGAPMRGGYRGGGGGRGGYRERDRDDAWRGRR